MNGQQYKKAGEAWLKVYRRTSAGPNEKAEPIELVRFNSLALEQCQRMLEKALPLIRKESEAPKAATSRASK